MKKKATKDLVENLLLFDPATERGKERLRALGLNNTITQKLFFDTGNGFWSPPIDISNIVSDVELNYDPTPDQTRIEMIQERRGDFDARFMPNKDREKNTREFTLLMGVVGAGKSLELQRQIYANDGGKIPYYFERNQSGFSRDTTQDAVNKQMSVNTVYIDMERVNTVIPIGPCPYRCTDIDNPLALFYTKLLATLIYYIEFLKQYHNNKLKTVSQKLTERFNNIVTGPSSLMPYITFVNALNEYADGNDPQAIKVFETIKETVKEEIRKLDDPTSEKKEKPVITGIHALLHMLGFVMIGVEPEVKKCIIVDNVEDLIKVSNQKLINISLDAAKEIYDALLGYAEYILGILNDAGIIGSFHIVMAFRRTTWNSLQARFAGNLDALVDDMFDITGDMSIEELWRKKGYPTWEKYLKSDYDELSQEYIKKVNEWLVSDETALRSVLQRYSRIMSCGLRRQGHVLSKTFFNMFFNARYGVLLGKDRLYLGKSDYETIFGEGRAASAREAKYLRKSAAIEFYFMDQYTYTGIPNDSDVGKRWRQLDVGTILPDERTEIRKYYGFDGERRYEGPEYPIRRWAFRFVNNGVIERPSGYVLRQLLKALSKTQEAPRASKCVAPLYEAVSLRNVLCEVFSGKDVKTITEPELRILSEVILAGGRPDTADEYSPLFILENGVDYTDIAGFQKTLQAIRDSEPTDSEDGDHPYSRQKCGIRITEAGADYLCNIQPSFEFFSALFCYDFPPLFFIKSYDRIAHVIGCVFKNAERVCKSFKDAGDSAFQREVKEEHMKYLGHYRDFLENNGDVLGFSQDTIELLKKQINIVIENYNKWGV